MTPSDYEMIEQGYDPPRMTSDAALEAAMLEWYGPDWRHRFFPGRSHTEIPRVLDAMRRAIEAANAVTHAAIAREVAGKFYREKEE